MAIDKRHILDEIKRLAIANGGKAPGVQVFERETGIKMSDWYPHTWLRWGDAIAEAGYSPNTLQARMSDEVLLQKYISLMRELKKFPVVGEIRRKAKSDKSFPSHTVFDRFGGKERLIEAVVGYCHNNPGFEDILELCVDRKRSTIRGTEEGNETGSKVSTGFVYLMKSGRHYKIGRTNSLGRRQSELAIKIPVPPKTVHNIETDDPVGVEAYWHKRFNDKRGEGEWFDLSPDDVRAFKRWKRIV
jgi:hypothetical protein